MADSQSIDATCVNCEDRKCMDCVLRYVHQDCREDCPFCCVLPKPTRGTPHDHSTFVEGCFRCELSRDEVERP